MRKYEDYYFTAIKVLSSILLTLSTNPKSYRDIELANDLRVLINKHKEKND